MKAALFPVVSPYELEKSASASMEITLTGQSIIYSPMNQLELKGALKQLTLGSEIPTWWLFIYATC